VITDSTGVERQSMMNDWRRLKPHMVLHRLPHDIRSHFVDPNRFDGLATKVGEISSRRQAVKWLGGIGAASLVAVAGRSGVEAKKKKRNKKQKGKTCTPGTSVGSVSVPANDTTVNTPVLNAGQRYRLRAVGFWLTNATFGNDAFAAFPLANPNAPETTFQGVRLGLSVNGGSPDQWGTYNANHTYEQQITGQGGSVTLRFTDPVPADNSGSLTVDIFCA
jgi:hypothetical protein